jgi:hypothetical protein
MGALARIKLEAARTANREGVSMGVFVWTAPGQVRRG